MTTQLNIEHFDFTAFNNYVDKHEVLRCIQDKSFEINPDDIDNFKGQIQEYFQENNLLDQEIIYYSNAVEFLKKHDQSLKESLGLAMGHGYTIENINSELLASLLASEHAQEEFSEFLASDTAQEIFDFLALESLEQELEKIESERVELNQKELDIESKIEELKAEIHARKNPVLEA
ncbi:hypothetical protein UFOVP571_24 [uncultured Caudovirales phage]|uniref:Uncharacterized protein n=1 Tax=uncultured Caudovirales phage TaxID=2100421 RepID=A0A6J5MZ91_9CAUD|nr:hypothetical protein UFOVP571_24 [uncultured Caudovirales phage]